MTDLDQSKIETLKKTLYSRTAGEAKLHILDLKKHEEAVDTDWHQSDEEKKKEIAKPPKEELNQRGFAEDGLPKTDGVLKRVLQAAAVFFLLSLAAAAYIIFKGDNVVAASKIKLTIVTPAAISSGQVTSMDVSVANANNSPINLVDVVLSYPDGTRNADDETAALNTDRVSFSTIGPNQTVTGTARAVFFGQDGTTAKINVEIQYRVPGSNTVFSKTAEQDLTIGTSALSLSVDSIKQITSGQTLNLTLTAKSNSPEVLKDVLLQASFPFGFIFASSTPVNNSNTYIWKLGDIEPGGTRTIKIAGTVNGETDETRFFRFLLGIGSQNDPSTISTQVATVDQSVAVAKPFLGTTFFVNNETASGFAAQTGLAFNGSINLLNNLTVPVTNIQIDATVNGKTLDMTKLLAADGITHSDTGELTWSKFEYPDLSELDPGQSASVSFKATLLSALAPELANVRNSKINVTINVSGTRISEANVPETITSAVSQSIPVSTFAAIDAEIVHGSGSIENQGNVPPKVNVPTQYAVNWTVANTLNDIDNAKVTAVLPNFLSWTGVSLPTTEKISFDPVTRIVTWDMGNVLAEGNSTANSRRVSFQISYTPTIDQTNNEPTLIDHATLSGTDSLTGQSVSVDSDSVTTSMPTDPTFVEGQEIVTQ